MPKKKQKREDVRLAVTEKGNKYLADLFQQGYVNITSEQRAEWDILHDLQLQAGLVGEGTRMGQFLAERPNTILGRKLEFFAGRGERGRLASQSYATTLHRLIKEGYVKSWIHRPEPAEA